jgi:hypothetical protein
MAISYINKGTYTSGTGAISVPVPAAVSPGNLLILLLEGYGAIPELPTNWINIDTQTTTNCYFRVCYKIAGASESSVSIGDSGNSTRGIMLAFSGVDMITPIHTSNKGVSNGTSYTSQNRLTTTVDNCMIIDCIGFRDGDSNDTSNYSSWTNASLTSVTEGHDQSDSTGTGGGLAFTYGINSSAGVLNTFTATTDSFSNYSASITLALMPNDINKIIEWNFDTASYNPSTVATHIVSAATTAGNLKNGGIQSDWLVIYVDATTSSSAVSSDSCCNFPISADSGFLIDFNRLVFKAAKGTSFTNGGIVVRTSEDSYGNDLLNQEINSVVTTTYDTMTVDLSGIDFQGINGINVKVYGWAPNTSSSIGLDNIFATGIVYRAATGWDNRTNLITNEHFSNLDSVNTWACSDSLDNGIISISGDGSGQYMALWFYTASPSYTAGDLIYYGLRLKVNNAIIPDYVWLSINDSAESGVSGGNFTIDGDWLWASFVIDTSTLTLGGYFNFNFKLWFNSTSDQSNSLIQIDGNSPFGAFAYNLTEIFGSGNEETALQIDGRIFSTRYWVDDDEDHDWHNPNNWSTFSQGTGGVGVPNSSNDVYFDLPFASQFTTTADAYCRNFDCSQASASITWTPSYALYVSGDCILSSYFSSGYGDNLVLNGSGTQSFNPNGVTASFHGGLVFGSTGIINLLNDLNAYGLRNGITIETGTFNTNNYNINADIITNGYTSSTSNCFINLGSSIITLSGDLQWPIWNMTLGESTINAGSSKISMNGTGTYTQQFKGGENNYNDLEFNYNGIIADSNTFHKITIGADRYLSLTGGTTTTIQDSIVSNGYEDHLALLLSTNTTNAIIAKSGGGTVEISYLSISYITGSAPDVWYVSDGYDGGNNTYIYFSSSLGFSYIQVIMIH